MLLLSPQPGRIVVVAVWMVAVMGQTPPTPAYLGDMCVGYQGVEGVCDLVGCLALQHEAHSLTIPEYIVRHSSTCDYDLEGNKLVCCPENIGKLASKSCGQSSMRQHQQAGVADPGAWPWMAAVYQEAWWAPDCIGVLVSEKHVLVPSYCLKPNQQHTVIMGLYDLSNLTDVQNLTSSVTIPLDRWRHKYPDVKHLSLMILDTPATLLPNKVWPVCVTSDPMADLGYNLDGLQWGESRAGIFAGWHGLVFSGDSYELKQKPAFLSNCSTVCEHSSCPSSYNASNGDLNPVCIGGFHLIESTGVVYDGITSLPFVVQSSINSKYYVAGLLYYVVWPRHESDALGAMIPVTPVAKDILTIIGE